jgi:hypothetical protein
MLRTLANPNIHVGYRYVPPNQIVFIPVKFGVANTSSSIEHWWNHSYLSMNPWPGSKCALQKCPVLVGFASDTWAEHALTETSADIVLPIRVDILEFVSERMRLKSMVILSLWSDVETKKVHVDCAVRGYSHTSDSSRRP